MENIAGFGRLVGWISIVLGGAALAIGLLISSPADTIAEFDRCLAQQRVGLRSTPCPPPIASGDKALLVGAGLGSIASGVFFLLLSAILTTLLAMLAEQQRARQQREQAAGAAAFDHRRAATSGSAPPSGPAPARYVHPSKPRLPTLHEMQQRYGEALGNRAWALMEANRKLDGDPLSEADAVMAARAELRAQQS